MIQKAPSLHQRTLDIIWDKVDTPRYLKALDLRDPSSVDMRDPGFRVLSCEDESNSAPEVVNILLPFVILSFTFECQFYRRFVPGVTNLMRWHDISILSPNKNVRRIQQI